MARHALGRGRPRRTAGALTLGIFAAVALSTLAGPPGGAEPVPSTDWVTSVGATGARNDFSGWVGVRVEVGPSNVVVDGLGRLVLAGNSGSHLVRLVRADTREDIALGNVGTAGQPPGAFAFMNLPVPVTLGAHATYYLLSQEQAGGDQWYDYGASLVTTSAAAATGTVWATDGAPENFNVGGGVGHSYGVPTFRYTTPDAAPSITLQPQPQTVVAGETAVFTAGATGSPAPAVQWQSRPPGGAFGPVSGATSTVLAVPNAALAASGTAYRAVFTNGSGSATTDPAVLTVTAAAPPAGSALVTYVAPSSLRNDFGGWVGMRVETGPAAISVNALGRLVVSSSGEAHAVRLVLASTGADVASATVDTVDQPPGTFAFAGLATPVSLPAGTVYYLLSQESAGGDPWYDYSAATITTSAAADTGAVWATTGAPSTFYVGGAAGQSYGVPNLRYTTPEAAPVVTENPQDQAVVAGGTAVFVAAGTGSPAPAVQWESAAPGAGFAPIGGATSRVLTVAGVTLDRSGTQYRAVFTNAAGAATSAPAVLTVTATPPPSGIGLVTYFTPSPVRNDFGGWVGMVVQVGRSDLSVGALGRWVLAGNGQSHSVRLVLASTGAVVASATVGTAGQPAGAFAFAALPTPVTLAANTAFYLVSEEFAGGDTWYDYNTATITTSGASDTGAVWATSAVPGTFYAGGSPGQSYGVPNLRYTRLNAAPVAVADGPYLLHEEETLAVSPPGPLANDSDADGDPLTAVLVDPPTGGTVSLDSNGGFLYQAATNFSGPDAFTYTANDGTAASNVAKVTLEVLPVNDAPVITLSGATATYEEDGSPVAVDPGLTVSDVDDTQLDTGKVEIIGGLEPGDSLDFDPGTSGLFDTDPSPQVLALSVPVTVADWQAALRSVVFSTTSQNPAPARVIRFLVGDGDANTAADKALTVLPWDDNPRIFLSGTPRSYTEDGPPLVLDDRLTVIDVDGTVLTGATVLMYDAQEGDVLTFTPGATGIVDLDPTPDLLWLTGPASVAQWQAVLRTVTFSTTHQDPRTSRDIQFTVEDGMAAGGDAMTIAVVPVNDAPTVALSPSTPSYTEDGPAVEVDAGLTVGDVDDTDLVSASVTIVGGAQAGDTLAFTPGTAGITDANPAADVLALTGTATVAQWQAVLRSVMFSSTNQDPGTSRTIRFVVGDGGATSVAADKTMAVVPVADPP